MLYVLYVYIFFLKGVWNQNVSLKYMKETWLQQCVKKVKDTQKETRVICLTNNF